MQVILKKDIPQLGRLGELVKVKDGYARNYLIPKALVIAADSGNLQILEHQKRLVEVHKKRAQKESHEVAKKLKEVKLVIQRRFNESGKMFGSLTNVEIAAELASKGYNYERRDIELEPIKAAGKYAVKVRLPGDVFVDLELTLEAQEEKVGKTAKSKEKAAKAGAKSARVKKAKAKDAEGDEESAADDEKKSEESSSEETDKE